MMDLCKDTGQNIELLPGTGRNVGSIKGNFLRSFSLIYANFCCSLLLRKRVKMALLICHRHKRVCEFLHTSCAALISAKSLSVKINLGISFRFLSAWQNSMSNCVRMDSLLPVFLLVSIKQ